MRFLCVLSLTGLLKATFSSIEIFRFKRFYASSYEYEGNRILIYEYEHSLALSNTDASLETFTQRPTELSNIETDINLSINWTPNQIHHVTNDRFTTSFTIIWLGAIRLLSEEVLDSGIYIPSGGNQRSTIALFVQEAHTPKLLQLLSVKLWGIDAKIVGGG